MNVFTSCQTIHHSLFSPIEESGEEAIATGFRTVFIISHFAILALECETMHYLWRCSHREETPFSASYLHSAQC